MSDKPGLLASFEFVDDTVGAIEELRKAGFDDLTAYSPFPEHHIEHALGYDQSPVRVFTFVGALTGAATGFAFPSWTSVDWPLITGGKPLLSIPAYVVISFELAVLFGALATVIGLFINSRLPNTTSSVVYDPEFSSGRFGLHVPAEGGRLEEARSILEKHQPEELREQREGAHA
jgi:Alternative complex III, ActD subunit